MAKINFYTGSREELNDKAPEDGAIYFVPDDEDKAIVAYDMNGQRYFVSNDTKLSTVTSTGTITPSGMIGSTNAIITATGAAQISGSIGQNVGDTTVTFSGIYTPAGSIVQNKGSTATMTGKYDKLYSIDYTEETITSTGNYQPAGDINIIFPTENVNVINNSQSETVVTEIATAAETVVTGVTTGSVPRFAGIITTSKNVIENVATGAVVKSAVTASVQGGVLILSAAPATTAVIQAVITPVSLVTNITTTAQTVVTGVSTASIWKPTAITTENIMTKTIITGQPIEQTFTGATAAINVTGSYQKTSSILTTPATITVTGTLGFAGTQANINTTGTLGIVFNNTNTVITVTGIYQKANSFVGTPTTVTVQSTKRFAAENLD